MPSTCSFPTCQRPASTAGLCASHHNADRLKAKRAEARAAVRSCVHCAQDFSGKDPRTIFCSRACKEMARAEEQKAARRDAKASRACTQCGIDISDKRAHARFCGQRCMDAWRNGLRAAERLEAKAGMDRPCLFCRASLPPERNINAEFCDWRCRSKYRRSQTYGLTVVELNELLAQHAVCAICATDAWGERGPQVDHDHATGAVRGILCTSCNNGLGRFKDDPALLRAAADYLERPMPLP